MAEKSPLLQNLLVILHNYTNVKNSMPFIWLVVRLHLWFQAKGALFLEFQSIKLPVRLLKLFWPRVVKPTSSCQRANAHLQPDVLVFDDLDFNVHYPNTVPHCQ